MGLIGVPMLIGPIAGPILGGWLVDDVSWRWIFYVNLPIGALALPLAARILAADEPAPEHRLDAVGLALLSPGLAAFVYGLAQTAASGNLGSAKTVLPLVAGALLIAAFVRHSLRVPQPLIDLRLFKNRVVSASALTTFLFGSAFFGTMLLLPLYYQIVRGQSALHAGLLLAPQGAGAMLAMPLAGRATDRTGPGRIVLVGLAMVVVGTIGFALVGDSTSFWLLGAALFVRGVGMGATMMPAMSAAYQTLTRAAIARATTALNIVQRVGGSLGTALLAVALQHEITARVPRAHGGLGGVQAIPPAARLHVTPKLAAAFGSTFWLSVVLTVVAAGPALLLPRHLPASAPEEDLEAEAERADGAGERLVRPELGRRDEAEVASHK